jgi:hypothetical protein
LGACIISREEELWPIPGSRFCRVAQG